MSASLRGLHADVRDAAEWALKWADYYGVPVTVTSTLRPWEQQERLRRRWEAAGSPPSCVRTATGLVCPANRPGDSAHNYGLAWDSTVPDRYQDWWDQIRSLAGFRVPPNDRIHAEVPNWRQFVS